MRWEIERAEVVRLVDNRLDHNVIGLQDRLFCFTISLSVILDNIEFSKTAKVFAYCAFVSIQSARELTDRCNVLTMLIEVLE